MERHFSILEETASGSREVWLRDCGSICIVETLNFDGFPSRNTVVCISKDQALPLANAIIGLLSLNEAG